MERMQHSLKSLEDKVRVHRGQPGRACLPAHLPHPPSPLKSLRLEDKVRVHALAVLGCRQAQPAHLGRYAARPSRHIWAHHLC
jgi:hypothetical protein